MSSKVMSGADPIEKTKKHLRSVLISEKGGVALNRLERDYRELVGQSLPYQALGFHSTTALLEAIPDVCSLQQRNGTLMVVGLASSGTAHILTMVNRQGKKQQGRGGGVQSSRGRGWKAAGQFDGRSAQQKGRIDCQRVGSEGQWGESNGRARGQACMGPTGGVNTFLDSPRQSGGRGMMWDCGNKPPGHGSSGKKFPGNNFFGSRSSGNQPPGKRPPCTKLPGNKFPGTGFPDKSPGNKFSGDGSSDSKHPGNRPPGNENPGSIQDGKREALQLCKGRIGNNEQRGAALKSSKSETGRENPAFVFGGNLSTVPSTSEKWTDVKTSLSQVRPAHFKEIPDLAKALQTAVKETVSDSGLHTTTNFKVGFDATIPNSTVSRIGGEQEEEERMKQLEQRVAVLEQQLREEKAAKETLLASVERALAGEVTCSELKLVRLIHDIKAKILRQQGEKVISLDLNGNETPTEGSAAAKHCKGGSPNIGRILHADVGSKARSGEASIAVKPYPGFLPRALALGTAGQNKGHQGDLRNVRHQKPGGPVVRGNLQTLGSMEDKMKENKMMRDKLSSKSAQSLSCHLRSPDGRMLA